ncbi:GMC family oxidoreductase [Sorangium sp. So ce119]|uniref:FAD-dependent oxidoreductase n=1 Tax=Sorangium sp. So ce119 TaxID=3133279 RepID=UPI003F63E5C3
MAQKRAIVIGTGFGGAVAACRLSQAGLDVTVLERGRRYDGAPSGLPRTVLDPWLWDPSRGLFDVRLISEIQIVQAAGYGGGSLIYANVHLRAPEEVFAEGWPEGYSREALDPYYDLVAYMLDIKPITSSPQGVPLKARRMRDAAEGLGRKDQFFYPAIAVNFSDTPGLQPNKFGVPQAGCTYCGECVIGCDARAKNSLDRNYLAVAERHGAAMLTECEVQLIWSLGPGEGYRVDYMDWARGARRSIKAEYVFVCAGAVNSTELLLRSRAAGGLPRVSAQLGMGYSGNGDLLAFAFDVADEWAPDRGPTITSAVLYDGRKDDDRGWFLLEEGGYSQHLWSLVKLATPKQVWLTAALPGTSPSTNGWNHGAATAAPARVTNETAEAAAAAAPAEPPLTPDIQDTYRREAVRSLPIASDGASSRPVTPTVPARMARSAVFLAMGRDMANGQLELRSDQTLCVKWSVCNNLQLYSLEERFIHDFVGQLGGTYGPSPFWRYARLPVTVHNLGGCRMADSEPEGVTSELGEVFNHAGLFVMDGAVLPSATGVNPSHTIAAVAERNIERIVRRVTGQPGWSPPERRDVRPFVDALSQVSVPPEGMAPPVKPALGLGLRERLSGSWEATTGHRSDAACDLEIRIPDIAEFVADPAHVGAVTGTLVIGGLTKGAADITNGVWNLFVPHGDGRSRQIRYTLPFQGGDGRPYTLHGAKVFTPRPGLELWDENTTLEFQIHEGADPRGAVRGRGVLRVGLHEVLRTATSVHDLGRYSPVEKVQARFELLQLYVGNLAKVALGRAPSVPPPGA